MYGECSECKDGGGKQFRRYPKMCYQFHPLWGYKFWPVSALIQKQPPTQTFKCLLFHSLTDSNHSHRKFVKKSWSCWWRCVVLTSTQVSSQVQGNTYWGLLHAHNWGQQLLLASLLRHTVVSLWGRFEYHPTTEARSQSQQKNIWQHNFILETYNKPPVQRNVSNS